MMRVGSLFSGIGGLELGLERAGMATAWQVEREPFCLSVLAYHWPNVTKHDDVTTFHPADFPPVDLICGGFPCQPHSVAGLKKGADDERDLWGEFARIVGEARPRWVVAENVPGLLSTPLSGLRGGFFGSVLRDLASLGYCVRWDVLSAAGVGAPHRRRRVFIVAHAHGEGREGGRRLQAGRTEPWPGCAVPNADRFGCQPAGREAGLGELGGDGPQGAPANATGIGLLRGEEASWAPGWGEPESTCHHLGHAHGDGPLEPCRCLADFWGWPGHPGGRTAQPRLGGGLDGLPAWLDQGAAQAWQGGQWEEGLSRTEVFSLGRTRRLKALGNAVVPQVAYAVGVAILSAETRMYGGAA